MRVGERMRARAQVGSEARERVGERVGCPGVGCVWGVRLVGRTLVLLPPRWTPALRTTFLGAAFFTTFFTTFFGAAFFTTWWGCGWA